MDRTDLLTGLAIAKVPVWWITTILNNQIIKYCFIISGYLLYETISHYPA
ncbi:MAG: hypothetical protein SH808_09530 [Saprospiraceae bacterium]|nr:hypothetical protein [Saprospiraceae bacterium]